MDGHHEAMGATSGNYVEVFCRSLALVGVAELFDKTWFMGLILALRYGARLVFLGSFAALFLHCFLAAALGLAFARFLSKEVLSWMTASVFFCFTVLYTKDWYQADPESDAIEAGKEEASGDCEIETAKVQLVASVGDDSVSTIDTGDQLQEVEAQVPDPEKADPAEHQSSASVTDWAVLGKSFMGVFIAEWGDRTQIAMIGQHASQPLVPVFLGSAVAFFLLTLSAVGAATLLNGQKLREKTVFGFSACCFAVFGLLALKDAIAQSTASHAQ